MRVLQLVRAPARKELMQGMRGLQLVRARALKSNVINVGARPFASTSVWLKTWIDGFRARVTPAEERVGMEENQVDSVRACTGIGVPVEVNKRL